MTKNIINIAEVELRPRPPEYAASGPAAQRFDALDVCEYPDSGKVAVCGSALRYVAPLGQQAGYGDGE
jgi:hypothetical protein